jgi:hypothetical protein
LFFILISGSGFNIRYSTGVSYYDAARCRSMPLDAARCRSMPLDPARSRSIPLDPGDVKFPLAESIRHFIFPALFQVNG